MDAGLIGRKPHEAAVHRAGPAVLSAAAGRADGGPWLGHAAKEFRLEPAGDPPFDRRLVVPARPPGRAGGWIVLSYRGDPTLPPARPMVRVLRGEGRAPQDFVLPGAAPGRAHWLGLIPADAREIRLAAGPGFVLERVGLRAEVAVLAQCLLRRPLRLAAALYERARGSERRYRDVLRGACAVTPMADFSAWAAVRGGTATVAPSRLTVRCLVLARPDEAAALSATLDALARQTHAAHDVSVAWEGARPAAPDGRAEHLLWDSACRPGDLAGGADALCLLRPGDILTPDALALLANGLARADLAYGDALGPDGAPRLKPDWSPDFALASGYVGRGALVSTRLLAALPQRPLGPLAEADLALDVDVAAHGARVDDFAVHVPRVLLREGADAYGPAAREHAVSAHLAAAGSPARAVLKKTGTIDLLWPLPEPAPLVSVVIPSRDRLDLIERVCRGVLRETAYPAIELVVVDNGSADPAVLAHYEELRRDGRVRILADPRPFNFAALVNAGVAAASGSVVVLLNNDVAVLEPGWLDALVRQACRPEVGAVGAKLLYGDGSLQHAGVVVGLGGRAGHILRRRPGDAPGHLGRLRAAHEVSAVTAACLAVARDKYRAVGGLDAEAFPVDFNDVDFCLRLGACGWKTVWTPMATLAHLESVSRGPSVGPQRARFEAEAARFEARWRAVIRHDPFYHPALSLTTFGEDLE